MAGGSIGGMSAVHRTAIARGYQRAMFKLASAITALSIAVPAAAQDEERQEVYDTFLSCAAFHTIEASRAEGNAAAAQQATAVDYAEAAVHFAPDGSKATTDADLKSTLDSYQAKLANGEPRAMAEQWTALETACAELHPVKETLVARRKAAVAADAPASR
jgi:hypothetical protein